MGTGAVKLAAKHPSASAPNIAQSGTSRGPEIFSRRPFGESRTPSRALTYGTEEKTKTPKTTHYLCGVSAKARAEAEILRQLRPGIEKFIRTLPGVLRNFQGQARYYPTRGPRATSSLWTGLDRGLGMLRSTG
jgi:hypothetical protein